MGISDDRVGNVLWRAWDISLQQATLFVILHCGASNLDQSKTKDIAEGAMKIAETFTKNQPKITTIISGMLPRGKAYSFQQGNIDEANGTLKAKCMSLPQTYFMHKMMTCYLIKTYTI